MFSGIVEEFATVVAIEKEQENVHFTLTCSFVDELKIDQSVAHNGVCLTVVKIENGTYTVTAMKETLERTNLGLLKVGDKVNVKILSMNPEKNKISLGLKQITPEPWTIITDKYQVGNIVSGKVVQLKEYGAFVELEPGLDGLVHISEVAHKRVANIGDELKLGQTVETKILDIDMDRKRISLSIKAATPAPEGMEEEEAGEAPAEAPVEEAPAAEAPVEEAAEAVEEAVEEAPAEE